MSIFDRFNLGHGFRKYFEILPALDQSLLHAVYRIRHEVYCEELAYEAVRPDRLEQDEYDGHSVHCLLRSCRESRRPVGCVRLIMTRPDDRDAPLPFERTCANALDRMIVDPSRLPRSSIGEVSRLAVRSVYRRRRGDAASPMPLQEEDFGSVTNPRFPYIPIGLYLGAIAMAQIEGVETLFVLTEPRLATHFARLGVDIKHIGTPVQHRGTRVPSMLDVDSVTRNMRFIFRPIWNEIRAEIEAGYKAHRATAGPNGTKQHSSALATGDDVPCSPLRHPACVTGLVAT